MTERLRANPYPASQSYDEGLGTKKTMLVLVVVVGCFAVLWPKLFYPMLVNNANNQMKPGPVDKTTGCCDVISELDLDTIKIMSELCSTIIDSTGKTPPSPKEIVTQCRKAILETCGIDISAALQDRIVSLGHSVKQILEEVRSLNGSLCLKYNFGLSPWRLGVPHRVNINLDPLHSIRQERPSQLRSEMVHPAFKERGRAIPQPDPSRVPRRSSPAPRIVEGRPGPIPGMRPAMGGPGHVVAPSKQSNYGFMGVLMPIYTIGFVVFFTYTVMKLVFKKKTEAHVGAPLYPPCDSDERFHKEVFEASKNYFHRPSRDSSKIVVNAVSALLEEVNQELEARKVKTPETVHEQDEIKANGSLPKEDEQGTVKVMGMETRASCEGGKKWSRPDSPVLPHAHPVASKEPSPPPQQIFLEGSLPPQSQILVAESATETQKDSEDDSPVVLAGKMTLSVISLDSETGTEDSSNSGKKAETSDGERRTSSSNVSEEFEKINAADLEDQIDNIIEEAENIALAEENRYSLDEALDKFTEEITKAPQINEKDRDNDVLEEIKNQLNLEHDLLLALKENEPEGKVSLPVTDIIKEFLNNEENALLEENKDTEVSDIGEEDMEVLERYKRSLSEERHDEEFKLNEIVGKDNEVLDIINKEEASGTFKRSLSEERQDEEIKLDEIVEKDNEVQDIINKEEASGTFTRSLSEERQDEEIKFDEIVEKDNEVLDIINKEEASGTFTRSLSEERQDEEIKFDEIVEKDNEVLDVIHKEEPSGSETEKQELEFLGKQQETLLTEELLNLQSSNDKLNEELIIENQALDVGDNDNGELFQQTKEEAVSFENAELKASKEELQTEKAQQNLVAFNEATNEGNSYLLEELEDVKNDHQSLVSDSEKMHQNLVPETDEINEGNSGLIEPISDIEYSKKEHQSLVSDSGKMQENLITESDEINEEKYGLIEEIRDIESSTTEHQSLTIDSKKMQQNLVTESQRINEDETSLIPEVSDLKSSKNNNQDSVSEDQEKTEISTLSQSREKTPEESNGNNKADLLLQGLMVREYEESNDQEDIANVTPSEQSGDQKKLQVLSTKTLTEKVDIDVDKPQHSIDIKEDISSHIDIAEDLPETFTEETKEVGEQNLVTENLDREENNSRLVDEEGLIDDEDYDDDSEDLIDDEVRDINSEIYEDRRESVERRFNGEDVVSSRNGAANSETAADNELSEDEDLENDDEDDEEIEEIIEYVDNTDDEGEEIIEINGNEQIHRNENGAN